jgi:hypothetical protein
LFRKTRNGVYVGFRASEIAFNAQVAPTSGNIVLSLETTALMFHPLG